MFNFVGNSILYKKGPHREKITIEIISETIMHDYNQILNRLKY